MEVKLAQYELEYASLVEEEERLKQNFSNELPAHL